MEVSREEAFSAVKVMLELAALEERDAKPDYVLGIFDKMKESEAPYYEMLKDAYIAKFPKLARWLVSD